MSQFVRQLTSWSFSRYKDWAKCPAYAKFKHLDKMKEPPSAPMLRGIDIANKSEKFLKGEIRNVPKELKTFADDLKAVRKIPTMFAEQMWGFDRDWNPVPWNDWNNCWLRIKVDVGWQEGNTVHLRDGKTGKFRPEQNQDYMMQLDLYIAGSAAFFPTATMFTSQLWYTDLGIRFPEEAPAEASRKKAESLKKEWNKRVRPMLADKTFKPTPGYHCRWCPFSKEKGGPCSY